MHRMVLLLQLLLLLVQVQWDCTDAAAAGRKSCPPRHQSVGKCNSEHIKSVTITYYEWNEDLHKCVSKIELKEVPCEVAAAAGKKGKCPEPRIVEPGSCNSKTRQEKTLVEHYEPDGKGGCKLFKSFTYPKCPDKPRPDTGCPEPRFYQKPCSARMRQVFKFYFELNEKRKCVEKSSIKVEPCGALMHQHKCPPAREMERGPCKRGFRTVISEKYFRDPAGHCSKRSHFITQPCKGSGSKKCPPTKVTKGPCRKGLRGETKLYYQRDPKKNRCVRKFRIDTKPCGHKRASTECPRPRVVEPGPCVKGHRRVLVAHYEPDTKSGRCKEQTSFVSHKCGGRKKTKKEKKDAEKCPERKFSQGACKEGYRNLFTFTFHFSDEMDKCVRHVALKKEHCAALVTKTSCPADDTVETGPCKAGFRSSIIYRHSRNAAGRCVKKTVRNTTTCHNAVPVCPKKIVKKVGICKSRIQRWMSEYFVYDAHKKRCVKKFRASEKPCGSSSSSKSKKCPKPRIVEPGPCKAGKVRELVEHWEFDTKSKKCKVFKSFQTRTCGKAKPRKKKNKREKAAGKRRCDEPSITQTGCNKGYRTVTTKYFEWEAARDRCVSKIMQKMEKCAKFVKSSKCPADATVEQGPCNKGFRTSIIYKYKRDAKGACNKKEVRVTIACASAAVACPPKETQRVSKCKHGIERWLTTYYSYSSVKRKCIRKLRFKEISCKKSKRSCPTPRVVEPEPCRSGRRRMLIEHYEFDPKAGKCVAMKDFVEKLCGKKKEAAKKGKKGEKKHECADPVFHQQPCRKKYRSVVKIYSEWSKVKARCVRKMKMEEEPCAALVKAGCPPDETVESGPCKDGFRSNIVFSHKRDSTGKCKSAELRTVISCSKSDVVHSCPKRKRKLLSPCGKSGLERWMTVYYVYSKVKARCVRKLKVKELSCKARKCPTPRVVEPGSCIGGKKRVLIEHYELDPKDAKCKSRKDYVHKICGKPSARKLAAVKHKCKDSVFHQKPCRPDGYRTVVKIYYRFNVGTGKCVSNVKVDNEKCSKLAGMKSSCHADEIVETGPCKAGFKQNIVFKYTRASDGSCERVEHRITQSCGKE